MVITDITKIVSVDELVDKAQWLVGKRMIDVQSEIQNSDNKSRVTSKAQVGYLVESGFFGIPKNSYAECDIPHLGVEIKTIPLKYNSDRTKLSVKEPLSLNIINYMEEVHNDSIKQSSLYAKNKKILFVAYIHDKAIDRSLYEIKYVFLWNIDDQVIKELEPDYIKIINMVKAGKAHEIHQNLHKSLTLCPKHGGKFKDPDCTKSKRKQPFSSSPAEIRAFRLKNSYMNRVIRRQYNLGSGSGPWPIN